MFRIIFLTKPNIKKVFVSPECKKYISSGALNQDYKYYQNGDIYSFGMILYMMISRSINPNLFLDLFDICEIESYEAYMMERIQKSLILGNYSTKLIYFITRALHPDPEKRASLEELVSLLSKKSSRNIDEISIFQSEYAIIKRLNHYSLSKMHLEGQSKETALFNLISSTTPNKQVITYAYLVEDKITLKRYNALCTTFRNKPEADLFYNEVNIPKVNFDHENIVLIRNLILQKNGSEQYQVYVVKVSSSSYFINMMLN
jgi:serine/threonine protein kinase